MRRNYDSSLFAGMGLFLEIVELGSFSAAGRQMGLSPSTVSRQIDRLEEKLGVRLFQRTTRKLSLTEAGEVLFSRAEVLVGELQELEVELGSYINEPRGLLHINAPLTFGRRYLAPALPQLLNQHSDLQVQLSMSNRMVDPIAEGIDLVVRIGRMRDSSLMVRRLSDYRRILIASQRYLEQRGRPRRLSELSEHNCLVYHRDGAGSTWRFRKGELEKRVLVTGNFVSDNADTLLAVCRQGVGIALLPTWIVAEYLASGELVQLLPSYEATTSDFDTGIFALYPSMTHMPAKLRAGIDFLIELCQGPPWNA